MGHGGTYLGEFEGMTFKDMKVKEQRVDFTVLL